ncbi:MAG TPA: YceI family protein [Isosphaeraceae bacterium]|jgi:polyisoprenoid-binding protein YceI|nr:YceI family protein [Isosphaeraceae bacterium]
MTARYRLDPGQSRFTAQAFATGLLSMLGHSPTFAVRDFSGVVGLDGPEARGLSLELTVRADSLELLDPVKPADREEIEGRMRREVLETASSPEIAFQLVESESQPAGAGHFRVFLGGRLTLHGVTNPLGTDAELLVFPDSLLIRGACTLRMSPYRIRPVTALGGAIKLKDEVKVAFDLVAMPEGS